MWSVPRSFYTMLELSMSDNAAILPGDFNKVILLSDESPDCANLKNAFFREYETARDANALNVCTIWGFPICRLVHPQSGFQPGSTDHIVVVYLFNEIKSLEIRSFSSQDLFFCKNDAVTCEYQYLYQTAATNYSPIQR